MAFGQNNKTEVSMNTRGVTMANSKSAVMDSRISYNFWNKLAVININPALPENQRSTEKVFDYESYMSIILSPTKAATLARAIKTKILPQVEAGVLDASGIKETGVDTAKGYIGVGTGAVTKGELAPYIIIRELEANSLNSANHLIYEFKSNVSIMDFDGKGNYTPEEDVISEMNFFVLYLEEYVKASTLAMIHMAKDDRKYYNKRNMTNVESIMTSLGIPVQTGKGYNNGNKGSSRFAKTEKTDYSKKETTGSMNDITNGAVS